MVPLSFRPQGDHAIAVIPAGLSPPRQIALRFVHYCVPTLPGQPQGLLLCREEQYEAWSRELDRVPIQKARRLCFLLHTRIEIRPNLRLPRSLLAYAGIQQNAALIFQPDGRILLTPLSSEEEN